jgi:uncharacterized RDD family membrane protein YckC
MTQSPEEIISPLPIASLPLRIVAFLLDSIVVFGLLMLFFAIGFGQAALLGDDPPDWSVYLALGITLSALFPVAPLLFWALWAWRSQSLGMMAVGLIVTTQDGYRLSTGRAFLRTLFWFLSAIPLGLGLMTVFFDDQRRALHDFLAGTVVRELR